MRSALSAVSLASLLLHAVTAHAAAIPVAGGRIGADRLLQLGFAASDSDSTRVIGWGGDVPRTVRVASAIAAGVFHSCAVQAETGAVVCWDRNDWLQSTPPPAVDGVNGVAIAIAAGHTHTLAIVPEPRSALGGVAALAALTLLGRRCRRSTRPRLEDGSGHPGSSSS